MTEGRAGDRIEGGENIVTGKPANAGARSSGKIGALAGARAIPPLMVVMFHFSEGHHYSHFRPLDLLATRGYLWVEFFFVLSGFILTHAYWARLKDLFARPGYLAFLRARLIRLYPLHLFMLLVLLLMVVGLRALAAQGGYLSIFDAQISPGCQRQGILAQPFAGACLEHDEHADLERRLLVRQRGIRALPCSFRSFSGWRQAGCGAVLP